MTTKLLTLLASLSLCHATCINSDVRRIYDPSHELQYDTPYAPNATREAPRLIMIGDVHGMRHELEQLLQAVNFTSDHGDRLIFAGDLVNKGPDSAGVVQLAMDLNATSVRGNHEDKVLRTWAGAEVAKTLAAGKGMTPDDALLEYEASLSEGFKEALATARSMTPEQLRWSADLPLSLRLGEIPGMGEVVVVHAGLAPGLQVQAQVPWAMYNVRTLLYPNEDGEIPDPDLAEAFEIDTLARLQDQRPGREWSDEDVADAMNDMFLRHHAADGSAVPISENDGRWWVDGWTEAEQAKPEAERLTLVYGHDSKRGLQLHQYSKGLDTRCVNGVELTAMVLTPVEAEAGGITLSQEIVSVPCPDGTS
ncbi:calcineurin-like phosphoesterase domain-containing protein [Sarocladium implicatum]|nr:calcineurin-like phosphoesterase domain-containing protein [Sarocladium implicatum]